MILLGLASGGLLAMAYVFQYGFGFWPCTMCYWQRCALLMLGLGILAFLPLRPRQILLMLAAAVLLASAGLALWHSVEHGLLPGPTACSGGLAMMVTLLLCLIACWPRSATLRRGEVLVGMSMANWNGIISLAMAGLVMLLLKGQLTAPDNTVPDHMDVVMDETRKARIERILRVDHAGELGAKRIYEGQLAVLSVILLLKSSI